jgi:hypothetical protein
VYDSGRTGDIGSGCAANFEPRGGDVLGSVVRAIVGRPFLRCAIVGGAFIGRSERHGHPLSHRRSADCVSHAGPAAAFAVAHGCRGLQGDERQDHYPGQAHRGHGQSGIPAMVRR